MRLFDSLLGLAFRLLYGQGNKAFAEVLELLLGIDLFLDARQVLKPHVAELQYGFLGRVGLRDGGGRRPGADDGRGDGEVQGGQVGKGERPAMRAGRLARGQVGGHVPPLAGSGRKQGPSSADNQACRRNAHWDGLRGVQPQGAGRGGTRGRSHRERRDGVAMFAEPEPVQAQRAVLVEGRLRVVP